MSGVKMRAILTYTFVAYWCFHLSQIVPGIRAARHAYALHRRKRRTYEQERRSELDVYGV